MPVRRTPHRAPGGPWLFVLPRACCPRWRPPDGTPACFFASPGGAEKELPRCDEPTVKPEREDRGSEDLPHLAKGFHFDSQLGFLALPSESMASEGDSGAMAGENSGGGRSDATAAGAFSVWKNSSGDQGRSMLRVCPVVPEKVRSIVPVVPSQVRVCVWLIVRPSRRVIVCSRW